MSAAPAPGAKALAHVRLKARLLPVVVLALALLQLMVPYRGWMILLIGLGGAWLIARLWAQSLAHGLRLRRAVRSPWSQVGDEMLERLSLGNSSWAPGLSVEVADQSTLPGKRRSRVVSVGGFQTNTWHQSTFCRRRGVFNLGPTTLRTGDPFGVYQVDIRQPATTSITVLPPAIDLPGFTVAPAGRMADGKVSRTGLGQSVSSASVRTYLPGDSLRRIHWPTSAHHDELYIRLFDNVSSGDWWIFLDLDRAGQAGEGEHSTEEHGVVLASSLAARGLDQGRSVGLVTLGEAGEVVWQPPRADSLQSRRLLYALALARPGPHSLAELLRASKDHVRRPASLLLITPAAPSAWAGSLRPFMARNAQATVFLFDSDSYGLGRPAALSEARQTLPRTTVHAIRRDWMKQLLPSPSPQIDWRQTRIQDQPWEALPS